MVVYLPFVFFHPWFCSETIFHSALSKNGESNDDSDKEVLVLSGSDTENNESSDEDGSNSDSTGDSGGNESINDNSDGEKASENSELEDSDDFNEDESMEEESDVIKEDESMEEENSSSRKGKTRQKDISSDEESGDDYNFSAKDQAKSKERFASMNEKAMHILVSKGITDGERMFFCFFWWYPMV